MSKKKQSAGLLMYHLNSKKKIRLLIAHPGGPLFERKKKGHWGIPKGEFEKDETAFEAACREFKEETGLNPGRDGNTYHYLDSIIQRGGKEVFCWAFEGKWPEGQAVDCNMIDLEWPPGSGEWHHFPEIDEVRTVSVKEAKKLMRPDQFPLVERLVDHLKKQQKLDPSSAQR